MKINIPGKNILEIYNLLLDYNGTIACDGTIKNSVKDKIISLNNKGLKIYVLTADTHGTVKEQCKSLPITIEIFDNSNAAEYKGEIVRKLCKENCMSIGNGFNDGKMFKESAISVAVIGNEGCSTKSLLEADIVCTSIDDALNLLLNPKRIIATLRG